MMRRLTLFHRQIMHKGRVFMPMPQDLAGRYIDYTIHMGGAVGGATTDHGQVMTTQTIPASVNVYNSGLVRTGPPWTFTYLKYVPGAVTIAALGGGVMTGPLSGCYIFRYTQNGQKVAHVGTAHSATDAGTIAAKTAWRALVAANNANNVTGSSPANCISFHDAQNAVIKGDVPQNSTTPIIVGYYTGIASYAMLLTPVPQTSLPVAFRGRRLLRVGAVKQMVMEPWGTIRNGPKFAQIPPAIPSRVGRPHLNR